MKIRAFPRRLPDVCVRVIIMLSMGLSADALAGSYDGLVSSFGNQTEEAEKTERQVVLPADTTNDTTIAHQNLSALASQNSFPLRMAKDVGLEAGWDSMPKGADGPPVLSKTYKVGECQFILKTSAYSVRTYEEGNPGNFMIAEDAVLPRKTFSMIENQPLNVSVATSVVAKVENKSESACRKLFKGRRVPIGRATLSDSELLAVQGSQLAIKATLAKEGNGTLLFVSWDEDRRMMTVVDEFDLPPTLETGVLTLPSPREKGIYYLSLRAKWSVKKAPRQAH